ncbi:hypothetical protein DL93DRAFT_2082076 [Clavulina sp. PMI_390]|nr:hypothetical protein DL93DRAFT_2082076 [Clavulina sp. PMI_390]
MSADLTFNNFGDAEQPLKLVLSAETKLGGWVSVLSSSRYYGRAHWGIISPEPV